MHSIPYNLSTLTYHLLVMYHIYHTDAIVLYYRNSGEADRTYTLYTRELGLLNAKAQSVRKIESKTRYALPLFAHARVDLIRGKEFWRLASGRTIETFSALSRRPASLRVAAKLARLTKRLCAGEEVEPRILDDLTELFRVLSEGDAVSVKQAELLYALRLLHSLGYIPGENDLAPYLGDTFSLEGAPLLPEGSVLFAINRAIRESQL